MESKTKGQREWTTNWMSSSLREKPENVELWCLLVMLHHLGPVGVQLCSCGVTYNTLSHVYTKAKKQREWMRESDRDLDRDKAGPITDCAASGNAVSKYGICASIRYRSSTGSSQQDHGRKMFSLFLSALLSKSVVYIWTNERERKQIDRQT